MQTRHLLITDSNMRVKMSHAGQWLNSLAGCLHTRKRIQTEDNTANAATMAEFACRALAHEKAYSDRGKYGECRNNVHWLCVFGMDV